MNFLCRVPGREKMSPQPLSELLSLFWVYSLKAESCKTRIPPGVTKHLDPLWGFKFFIYFSLTTVAGFAPQEALGRLLLRAGRCFLPPQRGRLRRSGRCCSPTCWAQALTAAPSCCRGASRFLGGFEQNRRF